MGDLWAQNNVTAAGTPVIPICFCIVLLVGMAYLTTRSWRAAFSSSSGCAARLDAGITCVVCAMFTSLFALGTVKMIAPSWAHVIAEIFVYAALLPCLSTLLIIGLLKRLTNSPDVQDASLWTAVRQSMTQRRDRARIVTLRHWALEPPVETRVRQASSPRSVRILLGLSVLGLFIGCMCIKAGLGIPKIDYTIITRWCALYGATFIFCMTPPTVLTWFVICFFHGKPLIDKTLRRVAEVIGIGTLIGLLLGSLTFAINQAMTSHTQVRPPITLDLPIELSVIGLVAGFGLSHFVAINQASQGMSNRALTWVVGPTTLGVATWLTQQSPLRTYNVADQIISNLTQGVVIPENPRTIPNDSATWRVAFAVSRSELVHSLPTSTQFCFIMFGSALILPVTSIFQTWSITSQTPETVTSEESI